MKKLVTKLFVISAALFCLTETKLAAQSADLIGSEGVPVQSLDKAALKDILLGKTVYWEGGQAIIIVVLKEKTDAALEGVTGMSASSFRTFWQRLTFSGRGKQPKEADSVEKLLSVVSETKGALALVPAGTPVSGVKKIELK